MWAHRLLILITNWLSGFPSKKIQNRLNEGTALQTSSWPTNITSLSTIFIMFCGPQAHNTTTSPPFSSSCCCIGCVPISHPSSYFSKQNKVCFALKTRKFGLMTHLHSLSMEPNSFKFIVLSNCHMVFKTGHV